MGISDIINSLKNMGISDHQIEPELHGDIKEEDCETFSREDSWGLG